MDDFLTKPWFIVLLGSILAIMMLSFGAMVFVKRKHMLMKQGALNTITGKSNFIYISYISIRAILLWYVVFDVVVVVSVLVVHSGIYAYVFSHSNNISGHNNGEMEL